MTDFEREHDMRPGYGYSGTAMGNAPAWIIGTVVLEFLSGSSNYVSLHLLTIEAFELYFLDGPAPDDRRAVFAVSPNVRLMTPYVQPALSFITNLGNPLYAPAGSTSVDSWWAIRLAATVVWDPVRQAVKPGQDQRVRTTVVGPASPPP